MSTLKTITAFGNGNMDADFGKQQVALATVPTPKEKKTSDTSSDDVNVDEDLPLDVPRFDARSMPCKQYLDIYVSPILLQAMKELNRERPERPISYLIKYLQEKLAAFEPPESTGSK